MHGSLCAHYAKMFADRTNAGRRAGKTHRISGARGRPAVHPVRYGDSRTERRSVDRTTEQIADFTRLIELDMLSDEVRDQAKRRMVDSLGCMVGGMGAHAAVLARSLAGEVSGTFAATALGLERPTTVEMATFANTI